MRCIPLILLLITLCAGCATTALITREKAIEIANAKAIESGWKLEEYELPSVSEYKYGGKSHWFLYYEGKAQTVGNHFSVIVDKQTGTADLAPGA